MAGFHQTIVLGNVGKEPELKYTANGNAVCNFSVAVNETYMQGEERKERVYWYNVVAWGKQAETLTQYLEKGRQIFLQGKMQTRSWEAPDGGKRYMTELVVSNFTFISGGQRHEGEGEDYEPDDGDDIPFEG